MKMEVAIFDMCLHNENITESSQILVACGKFMIFDIEAHSNINIYAIHD